MIAVVTNKHSLTAVIGKRDVAVRTLNRFSTRTTKHKTGVASTIQQDDRLLSFFLSFANGLDEFVRKDLGFSFLGKDLAHVDDARSGHRSSADSLGQLQVSVFAIASVIKRFERRRG